MQNTLHTISISNCSLDLSKRSSLPAWSWLKWLGTCRQIIRSTDACLITLLDSFKVISVTQATGIGKLHALIPFSIEIESGQRGFTRTLHSGQVTSSRPLGRHTVFLTGLLIIEFIALDFFISTVALAILAIGKPEFTATTVVVVEKPFDGEILVGLLPGTSTVHFGQETVFSRDFITAFKLWARSSGQTIGATTEFRTIATVATIFSGRCEIVWTATKF